MKKLLLLTTCISFLSINFGSDSFSWSDSKEELKAKVAEIKQAVVSIPSCFYDEETAIMNALEEAMIVKDPVAAKSKLEDIYKNVVGKNGSDRILSKDVPAETRQKKCVEHIQEPKITKYTHDDLIDALESRKRELAYRSDVEKLSYSADQRIPDGVLFIPIIGVLLKTISSYDGFVSYDKISYTTEVVRAARTERHSLSRMRSLFLELFSLVSKQNNTRNERRRQAEEDARKREAERKADEEKQRKVTEELAQRERELRTLSAAELRKIAEGYDSEGMSSSLEGSQKIQVIQKFITKAHEKGDIQATVTMSVWILNGLCGFAKDERKARQYFKQTYLAKARWTRMKYGASYDLWLDVEKEVKTEQEAARRQKEMAGLSAKALTELGHFYEAGTGGKVKDISHAYSLFKKVADMQEGEACFQVGRYLLLGLGSQPINVTESTKYFQKAFTYYYRTPSNMDAVIQRAWTTATKAQRDEEEARLAAEKARRVAEKHGKNVQQLRELGLCYLLVKKENRYHQYDSDYASKLLLEAYEKGDAESAVLLAQVEFYGVWFDRVLDKGDQTYGKISYASDAKIIAFCQEAYRRGIKAFNDPKFAKFNTFYAAATKDQRRRDERVGLTGDQRNTLACYYFNSTDKTIADPVYGVELFKSAHEAGSGVGSQNYARAFLYGWGGIKISTAKAYEVFQESYRRVSIGI